VGIARVLAVLAVIVATCAVAGVAGAAEPAPNDSPAATSTSVSGISYMPSIACAGSTTTCLAVGQYEVANDTTDGGVVYDYYGAAVVIDDGVPGTATTLAGTFIPSGVACSSSTACVMAGTDANGGALLPVTVADGAATFDTVQDVANTTVLTGVACPASANACVAVGEGPSSAVAVDLPGGAAGTAGTAEDLPLNTSTPGASTSGVMKVACSSASQCLAATSGAYGGDAVVPVSLSGGSPGTPQTVSNLDFIDGVSCVSGAGTAICEIVGGTSATDPFGTGAAVEFTGVTGTTAGTEQTIEQTPPWEDDGGQLDGVSCLSTSYCVGVGSGFGAGNGVAVAFQPNAAIGGGTSDPNVGYLTAVECQSASSCLEAGWNGSYEVDGYIDDLPLTAATGTLSGTVTVVPQDAGAPPSAASGAPVEACATDGSLCVAVAFGTDSSGAYSLAVPVGYSYVVTALSPAGANDTQASSSPTASVTSSGVSGIDVELTGPPALVSGVTVTSPEFGTESASTATPTVNWQQPFDVHIPASAFPSGQVTTVETLVITGTNGFTGQPQSETVYAGGETTTASGESAANGLVVGTGGVDIAVPALSPIHGPVNMAVSSFSVSSSPTGVALAGSGPLKFTQGALSGQATIVATDFGVDHTVGTPTISGADASTFALSAPMTCAPQPTIVQASGADANQSCSLGVTWTPPAAATAEGTYQATMNVPVTNSAGQLATLQVQLLGCDDRVSTGACQGQTLGTTTLGSLYIDPSGTVETTIDGVTVPLDGATVTMSQLGSGGTYTAVPNGSDVMSPANRTNPQITGEDGGFGWDTLAGTYEITASDSECSTSVTSTPETVPPPATNIDLILDCSGITQLASSTTLGFDPTTVAPGQAVELTATVSGSSPTGTVAFVSGGTTLATVPVDASTGEASYMTSALPPGQDTVTATYSGDASNATSSEQEKLTVESAPSVATLTAVSAAPSISTSGASVSYSATVTPVSGSADPTGTVTFTATLGANSTPLCTTTIQGTTASCSSASAPVGADTITVTYGGDTNFSASSGTTAELVASQQATQTITFTSAPPNSAAVGSTYALTATGGTSANPVTFSADPASAGICTVTTATVNFIGAGTCLIDANQAGDANDLAAPQVQQSVVVTQGSQSISFSSTAPSNATVGGATYAAAASASSGLPVALTIDASASGVCSIASGGEVSFTGIGTCVIDANRAADSNYTAATQVLQSFSVGQGIQTITFDAEGGSAVSSMSGPHGSTITLPGAPTLAGSTFDGWFAATSGGTALTSPYTLTSSLTLYAQWTANSGGGGGPTTPTVSISNIPSAAIYGGQFTPSFTTSGNGTVFSVTSSTASVCTVSGTTVNFVGVGKCTLTASVAATVTNTAATGSSQSFVVSPATATVSITNLPVSVVKGTQFTPSFKTSGNGAVFSVTSATSSVCTVSDSTVNFVGAGTCSLTVTVGATADYLAASNTWTISVKSTPKKLGTRTTVALSRTAISYGAENSVAVVVHVTSQASGHRLSGKVRIMVGNRLLCVATINSHGVAECTLAARILGRGTYKFEATYEGNSFYNQSTSVALKLRVN
jgi:uncharacterized repeat protein (TIGR02543 family)